MGLGLGALKVKTWVLSRDNPASCHLLLEAQGLTEHITGVQRGYE